MKAIFIIAILFAAVICSSSAYYTGLVNKEITRTIQLTSQLARHELEIKVSNDGNENAKEYLLAIGEGLSSKLAYLSATVDGKELVTKVNDKKQDIQSADGVEKATIITVTLPKELKNGDSVNVKVVAIFGHAMEPYPSSISQSERQLVRYRDNHFVFTPYTTKTCTTTVKLASSSVQTSSQYEPTTVKGDTITYGPYENLKPFSHSPMLIHFENNKPFLTIAQLNREITVSHWGTVSIEEFHRWNNDGAELKGGFSRYEFQINPAATGHAAIKSVDLTLPNKVIGEPYYRDAIGNISTSHFHGNKLQIIPRFPLFGGWKTKFCMGYDLPLDSFVFQSKQDASRFTLNITFGPQFDEDVIIDHQKVSVILPEGATDIKVTTPFGGVKESKSHVVTYLDINGRNVVVLEKDNLLNELNKKYFQVSYTYNTMSLLRGPILLVVGIFVVLFVIIVVSRCNITILPEDPKEKAETLMKVRGYVKKYKDILQTRDQIHSDLDRAVETHINSNKVTDIKKESVSARNRLEDCAANVNNFFSEIEKFSNELADKIREIEEKEEEKTQAQVEAHKAKLAAPKGKTPTGFAGHEKNYHSADEEIQKLVKDLNVE